MKIYSRNPTYTVVYGAGSFRIKQSTFNKYKDIGEYLTYTVVVILFMYIDIYFYIWECIYRNIR